MLLPLPRDHDDDGMRKQRRKHPSGRTSSE